MAYGVGDIVNFIDEKSDRKSGTVIGRHKPRIDVPSVFLIVDRNENFHKVSVDKICKVWK